MVIVVMVFLKFKIEFGWDKIKKDLGGKFVFLNCGSGRHNDKPPSY